MQKTDFKIILDKNDVELFMAHKEFLNDVEMEITSIDFEKLGI